MDRFSGTNFITVGGKRQFTDLNLTTNTRGSYPNAVFLTGVQESIVQAVEAAGLVPTDADNTQLLQAILKLTAGRLIGVRMITAIGATLYTPTPGTSFSIVEIQAGGGAAAGATGATGSGVSLGAPGTAGTYARGKFTAAAIGASQIVTLGAAGVPVAGAAGGNAASCSIGTLMVAPGGVGGATLTNQTAPTANGNGTFSGAATGANLHQEFGSTSALTLALTAGIGFGAPGGRSHFGDGGYGVAINTNGVAAANFGAGGGGVVVNSGGGTATGGAGGGPVAFIWDYN